MSSYLPYIQSVCVSFFSNHKGDLAIYAVLMAIIALERVAIPHVYGKLLQALRKKTNNITMLFGIIVLIYCVFQLCETFLTLMDAKLLPKFESFVRENVVSEIIDRHSQRYTELDLGNITSKLIKLPTYLRDAFYRTKGFLFNHVISVITTAAYLFYCHPWLGAIFSVAFGLLGLSAYAFCNRCCHLSYRREASFDHMQESIQDLLYNLLSVYNSRNEEPEKERLQRLNELVIKHTQNSVYCGVPFRIIFSIIFLVLFTAITGAGIYLHRTKRLGLDILVSSFIVTFAMLKTCMHFYYDFESFVYLQGGLKVVEDYLKNMPSIDIAESQKQTVPRAGNGVRIQIQNVSFTYPASKRIASRRSSANVLSNISLEIPAGQRVAIMGGIGSGKSSLGQLLVKLQQYQRGTLLLNGRDMHDISIQNVRQSIHYVAQHPRLFNRTLLHNLQYGNPNVTPKDVYDILHRLQMHDVLHVFQQYMHQPVGKQGGELSGGQRQIAWVLRALFTPSDVLILDEPTSALDVLTRGRVIQLIQTMTGQRTLVLITHDTELLPLVTRQIVLADGRIISDK
jgi:ABC-type multidrug transport system fused ATPase/permease subunit